jgi:hypothetical protein
MGSSDTKIVSMACCNAGLVVVVTAWSRDLPNMWDKGPIKNLSPSENEGNAMGNYIFLGLDQYQFLHQASWLFTF